MKMNGIQNAKYKHKDRPARRVEVVLQFSVPRLQIASRSLMPSRGTDGVGLLPTFLAASLWMTWAD